MKSEEYISNKKLIKLIIQVMRDNLPRRIDQQSIKRKYYLIQKYKVTLYRKLKL